MQPFGDVALFVRSLPLHLRSSLDLVLCGAYLLGQLGIELRYHIDVQRIFVVDVECKRKVLACCRLGGGQGACLVTPTPSM